MNSYPDKPPSAAERISANLRAALARKNLGRADLVNRFGMSPNSASRRLNGRHDFTVTELEEYAAWLDADLATLIA